MTEQRNNDGTSPAGGADLGRLEKMKERAAEKKFSFLYLYNPTQAIGLTYGAKVTLHVFGLDQQRKLAYVGAVAFCVSSRPSHDPRQRRLVSRQPTLLDFDGLRL